MADLKQVETNATETGTKWFSKGFEIEPVVVITKDNQAKTISYNVVVICTVCQQPSAHIAPYTCGHGVCWTCSTYHNTCSKCGTCRQNVLFCPC